MNITQQIIAGALLPLVIIAIGLFIHFTGIHVAIYTPKRADGSRTLLMEIGNPNTSEFKDEP